LARPILLFDFDYNLQFPQMIGVAQRMKHACIVVIVNEDADDIGQHLAAFGAGR
jgi:hypothetical protein